MNIYNTKPIRYLSLVICAILSMVVLKIFETPYVLFGLLWFSEVLYFSLTSKRLSIRLAGINLAALIIALTLYEAYLLLRTSELYITRKNAQERYIDNKFLGFAPRKNDNMKAAKYYKNELVYKAEYSIDGNGLRISPPYDKSNLKGCTLFFGDSFTFGTGVNDTESMPWQVGIQSTGKYKIYNFGFGGYGPHQMLSQLEHGIVKNIVHCNGTVYGIFQTIPDHINRAAGLAFWDYHGPRYEIGENGRVILSGNFNDVTMPKIVLKYLNKSIIYRDLIGNRRFFNRRKDVELYIAIVEAARRSFEKQFPGGRFNIIFWDNRSGEDEKEQKISEWLYVLKQLKSKGISVHLVSNILPDYFANKMKYNLSPYDSHPNALAHRLIAEYIIKNILTN